MKLFPLAAALFCLIAPVLHAQLDDTEPQYRALCREALQKPFTPPEPDDAFRPDCDSAAYYYGIGRPVDYAAARGCAYTEYAHPDASSSNIFAGAGILSMIYANGQGTPANLDLATRFTCEGWAAPAEIEGRLDILNHDRETHTLAKFDLCDTATSGNSEGWCESIDARLSDIDRNRKLEALRAGLPAAAQPLFDDLQKAEDDFVKLSGDNEVDLTGTARGSLVLEEQNDLRDQFLADLTAITSPEFHEVTAYKAADKKLNTAYKPLSRAAELTRLPREPKTIPNTTIAYKSIQETQRAWVHLRDAWMSFAKAASSVPNADKQIAARVSLERAQQLSALKSDN